MRVISALLIVLATGAFAMDQQEAIRYRDLAEQASEQLRGPAGPQWMTRLDNDYAGIREALGWFVEHRRTEDALRLASALSRYWQTRRDRMTDGREWFAKALALPTPENGRAARGRALRLAGLLAFRQGDARTARALNEEGLRIWREIGDKEGIAAALAELARIALRAGEHDEVRRYAEESIALSRELGRKRDTIVPLHLLAASARMRGDYRRASELYAQTTALYRAAGNELGIAEEHFNMGYVALRLGDVPQAATHFKDSIAFYRARGNQSMIAACLGGLGGVAFASGEAEKAAWLLGGAEAINRKLGVILDPDDKVEFDRDVAATRAALAKERFDAAWAAGQAMTIDEAVALALR